MTPSAAAEEEELKDDERPDHERADCERDDGEEDRRTMAGASHVGAAGQVLGV